MPRLRRPPWTWEKLWFALLAVLMALGLAALWCFPPWLFEPRVRLIPLALFPERLADYRAEPRLAAIPPVSLSLIRQALQDRQSQAQFEAVLRQLDTPIPTATANRPLVLPATPTPSSLPGVTIMPVTLTPTPTPTATMTLAFAMPTLSPTTEVSPTVDQRPTRTPQPTQTQPPTATPRPTSTSLPPSPTPRPPTATAPAYPPPATPLPPTPVPYPAP